MFVWYELLFKLGVYKGLKRDVDVGIEVELARVKAEKEGKGE
jgi:uncharacterized membrane protein YGL010W